MPKKRRDSRSTMAAEFLRDMDAFIAGLDPRPVDADALRADLIEHTNFYGQFFAKWPEKWPEPDDPDHAESEALKQASDEDCGMLSLMLAARDTAQELVNTWEAFGAFCRTRVGVSPEVMLRAWQFPVAGDFEQTLKRYAHLKPDPAKVKQYTRWICINWDRWFNPGKGFDRQGGGTSTDTGDGDEGGADDGG